MRQSAAGCFCDVEQRREYDVRDTKCLSNVGNIFALCQFNFRVCGFPVICYEKDGVGASDGLSDGILGVEICLCEELLSKFVE